MFKISILLLFAFLIQESNCQSFETKSKTILIPTFNELASDIKCIQYYKGDDGKQLLYLSFLTKSHAIYKFEIGDEVKLERRIDIEIEGPDGINTEANMFYVFSPDTILVFDKVYNIHLLNEYGHILKKVHYDIFLDKDEIVGTPLIYHSMKSYKLANKIIIPTLGSPDYTVKYIGLEIDINNLSVKPLMSKEEIYKKFHGDANANVFHFLCASPKSIFFAPAFSNEVIEVNPNHYKVIDYKEANIKNIKKAKPLARKKKNIPHLDQHRHSAKHGFYYDFMYDPYQDKFYRRGFLPNPDFVTGMDVYKYPVMAIFDQDMKKLKEFQLPSKHKLLISFMSNDGLCIFNQDTYNLDENYLPFDCYKF